MRILKNMCTFAAAKVVVALAISYQRTEKEQFRFQKGGMGCFFFMCVYEYGKQDDTKRTDTFYILNIKQVKLKCQDY